MNKLKDIWFINCLYTDCITLIHDSIRFLWKGIKPLIWVDSIISSIVNLIY